MESILRLLAALGVFPERLRQKWQVDLIIGDSNTMKNKKKLAQAMLLPGVFACPAAALAVGSNEAETVRLKTVEVISAEETLFPQTAKATPTYEIQAEEVEKFVNATTVEDYFRTAPSLNVRKRYIGDPNGNLGMRGSNVFQTAHTMVFADGMPLHNPLRTSYNGAPRWSMVSPSELESAEILYGPFSAQYSGHSFGGVVNLITHMPEKFEMHMDAMGIFQTMHRGGRNETLTGYKTNISAGNRFDKFSIFGSYNRLENQGQPMTPRTTAFRGTSGTPVTGPFAEPRPDGTTPGVYYGDDGLARTITDLYKLKMGYDFTPDLQGRFTVAYEERNIENNDPLSLLRDPATGSTLWGGSTYNLNGNGFSVPTSVFGVSESERKTINLGLGLKGKISDDWSIDTTASYYDAFKDKSVSSAYNPSHPLNDNSGQVSDVDAWWANYDLKLSTDNFLQNKDLSFMGGYQFSYASLNSKVYSSNNYLAGSRDNLNNDSGGQTQNNSVFSQIEWRFLPDWAVMVGARLDHWKTIGGHIYRGTSREDYADRDTTRISPKASLEFSPDAWTFRYSFSKAYRFPIAEELFLSSSSFNARSVAFPGLGPENGYFHNFMIQYDLPKGFIRANFFYDLINDEIANTTNNFTVAGVGQVAVRTFQPIEQTETIGVDLTFQQNELFDLPLDFMVNGTFMNKQIVKNSRNTSLVGNEWDRIPKLQVNTSAVYHILPVWDFSASVRYRSDVFQQLDNSDTGSHVYGGTDEYTFVDLKTAYQLPTYQNLKSTISAGIDNVLDQNVYENHPFPQRTYFVKASIDY